MISRHLMTEGNREKYRRWCLDNSRYCDDSDSDINIDGEGDSDSNCVRRDSHEVSNAAIACYNALVEEITNVFEDENQKAYKIGARSKYHLLLDSIWKKLVSKLKEINLFAGRVESRLVELFRHQVTPNHYTIVVCRTNTMLSKKVKRLRQALREEVYMLENPLRTLWTDDEVKALREGLERYTGSSTPYGDIIRDKDYRIFWDKGRTNTSLRDKARNLGIKNMVRVSDDDDVYDLVENSLQVMAAKRFAKKKRKRSEIIERRKESAESDWSPRLRWTDAEEQALIEGYNKYISTGCKILWAMILKDPEYSEILQNRNNVNLKDKMRNLQRNIAELN